MKKIKENFKIVNTSFKRIKVVYHNVICLYIHAQYNEKSLEFKCAYVSGKIAFKLCNTKQALRQVAELMLSKKTRVT